MTLVKDYGLEQPARAYLILALSVEDKRRQNAMDKLHAQKIIRYFEFLGEKKDVDFSNFKLGAVSYELEENLATLEECGFIIKSDRTHFELTNEGKKAADELKSMCEVEDFRKLAFSKQLLNDLTPDDLMFFMYKVIPETQANSTEVERLFRRSREHTESLFKKGRISATTAAEWLGMSERELLTLMK